jgi:NMD protein affecting ribosome stability and mRNA decay
MTCERCGLTPAEFEVAGGSRRERVCDGCLAAAQREAGTPRSTTRIRGGADNGQGTLFDVEGGAA